jgi:predicted naringenin-chalcone synthase
MTSMTRMTSMSRLSGMTRLIGMGTATPPGEVSQRESAEHAIARCCTDERGARLLRRLYAQTGIDRRASALINPDDPGAHEAHFPIAPEATAGGPTTEARMRWYAGSAPALAHRAALSAIDDAQIEAGRITHLVTVSCTGFSAPGFDIELIGSLRLRPTVERTHLGFMGCHGALNGLRIADAICRSSPGSVVLLVAVELCTIHFQQGWDEQRLVANSLFADGAASVVLRAPAPDEQHPALAIAGTGACVFPETADAMTWRITDHGFAMTLSPAAPAMIRDRLAPWLSAWLDSCGLRRCDIGSWAIHPGGPRILTAVEEALGLTRSDTSPSRDALRAHGNMSSPTILFILERMRTAATPRPIVALGFGPGLAVEGTLLA